MGSLAVYGEEEVTLYALRPVLIAGKQHDPYFDRLFPEIADEIEVDGVSVTEPTGIDVI